MSQGTYGTIKPSLVNIANDVEIWYHYRPSRSTEDDNFKKFKKINEPSEILEQAYCDNELGADKPLLGMYNLKLSLNYFNERGIYTIYIKPKEIVATIKDIGTLTAYSDIRGIVLDSGEFTDSSLFENGNLVGYRIEYIDGDERQDYYRIITSNNKAQAVAQNLTSTNTNSHGYTFNDNSTYVFLTVTPSTAPGFKSSATPFIGTIGQKIVLTNTKFNPVMVEVELVQNDIDTLTTLVGGDQIRVLDKGLITTFNENGEIFKQDSVYTLKDNYTKRPVVEVRENVKTNIDSSFTMETVRNNS